MERNCNRGVLERSLAARVPPARRHLFQNRYQAVLCDQDAYLLQLVCYPQSEPGGRQPLSRRRDGERGRARPGARCEGNAVEERPACHRPDYPIDHLEPFQRTPRLGGSLILQLRHSSPKLAGFPVILSPRLLKSLDYLA